MYLTLSKCINVATTDLDKLVNVAVTTIELCQ